MNDFFMAAASAGPKPFAPPPAYAININFGSRPVTGDLTQSPLALGARPHEHVWLLACPEDQHQTTVFDCACGARKRTRKSPAGEDVEVTVPAPTSPLGDVLFDCSHLT